MLALAGILAALAVAPGHAEIAFESDGRDLVEPRRRQRAAAARGGGERREALRPRLVARRDRARLRAGACGRRARKIMLRDAAGTRELSPRRTANTSTSRRPGRPTARRLAFTRYTLDRRGPEDADRDAGDRRRCRAGLVSVRLIRRMRSVGEPAWSPDGDDHRLHAHQPRPALVLPARGADRRRDRRRTRSSCSATRCPRSGRRTAGGWRSRASAIATAPDCGSDECSYAAELYTAAADGSAPTRLTRNDGDDGGAGVVARRVAHPLQQRSQPAGGRRRTRSTPSPPTGAA